MLYLRRIQSLGFLIIIASLTTACSTTEIQDSSSTNPADEIAKLEADENTAAERQVNVLAPTYFAKAQEAVQQARKMNEKSKEKKTVLAYIAKGREFLTKADEVSRLADTTMAPVIQARHEALMADALKYFPNELTSIDEELRDVTRDIEDGSTKSAEKNKSKLQTKYMDLELMAIKHKILGWSRMTVKKAVEEGAPKAAPRTLSSTEKKMTDADAFVTANRHSTSELQKLSQEMASEAARLLKITREAKRATRQDPEEIALEMESQQNSKVALEGQLLATQTEVKGKEQELSRKVSALTNLEMERDFNQRFESVRDQFSRNEAEVYKEGNKLLIRLKGLTFPAGQAVITPSNYPLLGRVQKVIKKFGDSSITIEGHTDSVGSKTANEKLSAERAKAVESYFMANEVVPKNKVTTVGYGDEKPIASNRTKMGRAQNRRIDLILEPERNLTTQR